jgi:hypothetical protein
VGEGVAENVSLYTLPQLSTKTAVLGSVGVFAVADVNAPSPGRRRRVASVTSTIACIVFINQLILRSIYVHRLSLTD